MKRDENTISDTAEKLELVSNTNMVTKEELSQKFVAEDVIKNKMITVAGQMSLSLRTDIGSLPTSVSLSIIINEISSINSDKLVLI